MGVSNIPISRYDIQLRLWDKNMVWNPLVSSLRKSSRRVKSSRASNNLRANDSWCESLESRQLLAFTFFDVRPPGGVNLEGFSDITEFNGSVYFRASDGSNGSELWKSDGTNTTMVKDIRPGASSGSPSGFIEFNSKLYFSANDGSGNELWSTDGTEAGTMKVVDLNTTSGTASSSPGNFAVINNTLFFSANNGTDGVELWKSDGTSGGTSQVKNIHPTGSSSPTDITNVGGTIFFVANDGTTGKEVWKTDGTSANTMLLKNIKAESSTATDPRSSSYPTELSNLNGTLVFQASNHFYDAPGYGGVVNNKELWVSDGTSAGTVLLKEINPVDAFSGSDPNQLTVTGTTLFFRARDNNLTGNELWKTDGTSAGTVLVKDINPGSYAANSPKSSNPTGLVNVGGTLFFSAKNSDGNNIELWKSDGTSGGTVAVSNVLGADGIEPRNLANINGTLFFWGNRLNDNNQDNVFTSTGTGVNFVAELNSATFGYAGSTFTDVGGTAFFVGNDGSASNNELFKSDGSSITQLPGGGNSGSNPSYLTDVGGTLFFRGTNGVNGYELFSSDGTAGNTGLVKDIRPGNLNSDVNNLTNVGGTLFFRANDGTNGAELWKSDGTSAGTVLVQNIGPSNFSGSPSNLTNVNNTLFFSASNRNPNTGSGQGFELWKSDGTTTTRVTDIVPGDDNSSPTNLTNVNGTLFFSARRLNSDNDDNLFKYVPGSGLTHLRDMNGTSNYLGGGISSLVEMNGTLFFVGRDPAGGSELWKSDGTVGGTVRVKDIVPGMTGGNPSQLVNVNNTLFFRATDVNGDTELWKSDGTDGGTVRVADIRTGNSGSFPSSLTEFNGKVVFTANDGLTGTELWSSDGTAVNTVRLADINPGINSGSISQLTNTNGTLFFRANDGMTGNELWKYDSFGVALFQDFEPGVGGSDPDGLANVGGTLFLAASEPVLGRELAIPGLNISKFANDASGNGVVVPGEVITYTIVVTNYGKDPVTNVSFSDSVPANATFTNGSAAIGSDTTGGTVTLFTGDDAGETPLQVNVSSIAPGGGAITVTFDAVAGSPPVGVSSITNLAQISADGISQFDSNPSTIEYDSMTLSGTVWEEQGTNSTFDSGTDTPKHNVTVNLYLDDGDNILDAGDGAPIATTTTSSGIYTFSGLFPGDYIVEVAAAELMAGGDLESLESIPGNPDPDDDVDNDDNGAPVSGFGVASLPITLAYGTEPSVDIQGNAGDLNSTLDLGFRTPPPNAVPVLMVGDLSYTEGQDSGASVLIDSTATASDSDGDAEWNGGSLTVQITANNEASDELSINTTGGISVSGANVQTGGTTTFGTIVESSGTANDGIVTNGDLLTINFNSNATNALVQSLVQAIGYRSTSSTPSESARTVTFIGTDTNSGMGTDTATINVDNRPEISVGDLNYSDGQNSGASVIIDSAATAADNDGSTDWNGGSLTVQITANNEATDEIAINDVGSISVSGSDVQTGGSTTFGTIVESSGTANDGVVTNGDLLTINFNANATNALVQDLVRAIGFRTTTTTPTENNRTVTFTVTDTVSSGSDTSTVSVDDAPTISVDDLSYTEGQNGGNSVVIDSMATAIDSDGNVNWNGGSLTVQLTNNSEADDEIAINDVGGISVSGSNVQTGGTTTFGTIVESSGTANDGVVTNGDLLTINLNANATNALVQDLVRTLGFRSTSSSPSELPRTATFTLSDATSGSSSTATINVTDITTPPSTVEANGPVLEIGDPGSSSNNYNVFIDTTVIPNEYVITDPGNILTSNDPSAIGSGTDTLRFPITGINSLMITGSDGDDTLTVDGAGGLPPGGINYDGGGGNDGITVNNLPGAFEVPLGAEGSGIVLYQGAPIITFTGLEPIDLSANLITTLTIEIDPLDSVDGPVTATVSNHPTAGISQIDFDNGLESVIFPTPTDSLTIIGDPNDGDIIDIEGFDASWNAPIFIVGSGGGLDSVTFQSNPTDTGGGGITIDATNVTIHTDVSTGGGNVVINANGHVHISGAGSLDSGNGDISITGLNQAPVSGNVVSGNDGTSVIADAAVSTTLPGFTVPTGTDRLLLVDVGTFTDVSAVTFDGMALTQAIETLELTSTVVGEIWYLPLGTDLVSSTTGDIVVTGPTTGVTGIGAQTFSNVDQANPVGGAMGATIGIGATMTSQALANNSGGFVVDSVYVTGVAPTATTVTGRPLAHTTGATDGFNILASSLINNTVTATMDWTLGGPFRLGGVHNALRINNLVSFDGDSNLSLSAGASISSGTGSIDLTFDLIGLSGLSSITGSGDLTIAPFDPSANIGLGGGAGELELSDTALSALTDGFSSITIGDATNGTGIVDIDTVTLTDDTSIVGGSVELEGLDVGANTGDVTARTGAITTSGTLADDVVATTATLSGDLEPGGSPGKLDVDGNLVIADDSSYTVEVEGPTGGDTANDHDQITVAGDVTIGNNVTLSVSGSGSYMPMLSDEIILIDNQGSNPVMGTFAGLSEGAVIANGFLGTTFTASITYVGGTGNDVAIELIDTPQYDFSLANYTVLETDAATTTSTVTVLRSGNTSNASSVDVVLTGNTAEANDFVPGPLTVGFAPGETMKAVPIGIVGDTLVEVDETIDLSFTNLIGGGFVGITQPMSTLTITEDDSATISIDNVSVVESGNMVFTVTLSGQVDVATTLQADTATSSANNADFIALTAEPLSFPAGSQTQTVAVQTLGDFLSEADETFFVNLSNIGSSGRDVTFADSQGRGTIIDIPLLAIDDVTVIEGDSGTTTALVPARLSEALSSDVYVEYEVQPGTATPTDDYLTLTGNFTIPAGDTSFDFPISVVGDVLGEANETFTVVVTFLDSPGNMLAAGDSRAEVTIQNDDGLNVVGVKVGSTHWDPAFKSFVDPSDGFGYSIPTGAAQLAPLPWANINQMQIKFNSDISGSFAENLFGLGGFHTADYHSHIQSTVYDASDFTVTITLDTFLGDDQLVLVASDLLTIASGDALDGEWTTGQASNVSGDGTPGGNFEFRFDVLPGDVNQSGNLSSNDGFAALRLQSQSIGDINYLAAADIDGSGSISSNDGFFALARQSTELPKGTPTVPLLPHAAKVDLAVAIMASLDDEDDQSLIADDTMDEVVDEFVADLPMI